MELQTHPFLTSALDRSEWSASDPGPFTLWCRVPTYQLNRRVVEPTSWSSNFGSRGKCLSRAAICTPDHLDGSPVTIPTHTTLCRLHKYKRNRRKCQDFYLPLSLPEQSLIPTAILAYGYNFKSAWDRLKIYIKFTPKEITLS
jgi:hypothetical protein